MAVFYISEYARVAKDSEGRLIASAEEPSLAEQQVAIGVGSAQSSALNATTRFVRLHTDAICFVSFGTNPTASSATKRMAANQTEYFAVPLNKSYKIAVIQGS